MTASYALPKIDQFREEIEVVTFITGTGVFVTFDEEDVQLMDEVSRLTITTCTMCHLGTAY